MPHSIQLPLPEALLNPLEGREDSIRESLEILAAHEITQLQEFASISVPDVSLDAETTETGTKIHDLYDEYFDVQRSEANPADELGLAFLTSLARVGRDAERGHKLDPVAIGALLRGVQVQAKILLQEAYYETR